MKEIQRVTSENNKVAQPAFSLPPPHSVPEQQTWMKSSHDKPRWGIPSSCGSHLDLAKITGCLLISYLGTDETLSSDDSSISAPSWRNTLRNSPPFGTRTCSSIHKHCGIRDRASFCTLLCCWGVIPSMGRAVFSGYTRVHSRLGWSAH